MKKFFLVAIVIVLLFISIIPPVYSGIEEERNKLEKYKQQLEEIKRTIKDISESTSELQQLSQQLDYEAQNVSASIKDTEKSISKLNEEISIKEASIKEREKEIALREAELEELINLSYKISQVSTMELLYEGNEPAVIENRISYISYISSYSEKLMAQAKEEKEKFTREKTELEDMRTELKKFLAQKQEEQAILEEELQIKAALIKSLTEKKTYYLYKQDEIEKLIKEEEALIKKLIEEAREKSSNLVLKTGLIWPVKGVLTSEYGWRIHPIWGGRSFHEGIDLAISNGTPVKAAAAGEVTYAGWMTGYGNTVMIFHGSDVTTLYGHLKSISVKKGQSVKQGQIIAYSDNTGWSTGPHLHFGVYVGDNAVNPLQYLPP